MTQKIDISKLVHKLKYIARLDASVEQIVVVIVVASLPSLSSSAALTALAPLSSLAALSALSALSSLGLHLDVSVGESIEEKIGCQFFIFIAGEVSLGCFNFTKAELSELPNKRITLLIAC